MLNMKTYLIFQIQAFETLDERTGNITDACTLEIIEQNEQAAVNRAKDLIKKKLYRVSHVFEKPVPQAPIYNLNNN